MWQKNTLLAKTAPLVTLYNLAEQKNCSVPFGLLCNWQISFKENNLNVEQDTRLPPGYFAPSNIVKDAF